MPHNRALSLIRRYPRLEPIKLPALNGVGPFFALVDVEQGLAIIRTTSPLRNGRINGSLFTVATYDSRDDGWLFREGVPVSWAYHVSRCVRMIDRHVLKVR